MANPRTVSDSLSRVNYCNVLFSDAPQYLLKKLQKLQNAAARFVYRHVNENDVVNLKCMVTNEENNLPFLSKTNPQSTSQFILALVLESYKNDPRDTNLRSDMENELNIDISRSFEWFFAHQPGKTFNELPINTKNIEHYEHLQPNVLRTILIKLLLVSWSYKIRRRNLFH